MYSIYRSEGFLEEKVKEVKTSLDADEWINANAHEGEVYIVVNNENKLDITAYKK